MEQGDRASIYLPVRPPDEMNLGSSVEDEDSAMEILRAPATPSDYSQNAL